MFKMFWEPFNTGRIFIPFTAEHLLGVAFVVALIMIVFKNKEWFQRNDNTARKVIASVLFIQQFMLYAWYLTSGSFSLGESLPLYTCRIAILLSVVMILKPSQKIFDIVYFWGIIGGIVALITPDTSTFAFPHFMFVQYFVGHGFMILGIVYMLVIKNFTITECSLKRVYKISLLYIIGIIPINFLVGGNYSYLRAKPKSATLLDAFPPFPGYVPIIILIMFSLFFIAYMPFKVLEKRSFDEIIEKRI